MIEEKVKSGIDKFYFFMKLSGYFWLVALCGGIILGIGPAWFAIVDKCLQAGWEHRDIRFRCAWHDLKKFFKYGNIISVGYLLLSLFIFFSLVTSSQLSGIVFLMIDFILAALLLLLFYSFLLVPVTFGYFDISLGNTVKLSLILFFYQWKSTGAWLLFCGMMVWLNIKMPAFILFISSGASAMFMAKFGERLLTELEKKQAGNGSSVRL